MMNQTATEPVIAVVDDDESVRRSLARFLRASGFRSVVYRSAEAFLDDPEHCRFDCLIVDLQLGGMSGVDLQEYLASAGEKTPMILMTARDERERDMQALQVLGAALLHKSDSGEVLLATLQRMTSLPVSRDGLPQR